MKILSVIGKGIAIVGILYGLSSIQAWLVFEVNGFIMNYTQGIILLAFSPILAYFLIGVLVSLGYPKPFKESKVILLVIVTLMIGFVFWVTADLPLFFKNIETIHELSRVSGMILGLILGSAISYRYLKTKTEAV